MAVDITEQFLKLYGLNSKGERIEESMSPTDQSSTVLLEEQNTESVDNTEEQAQLGSTTSPRFDPTHKLIKVKGGALYLQVRDRLIWLREEHPEARIETYLVNYYPEDKMWVVKAEVSIWTITQDGSVLEAHGTGLAQETERDFPAGALEKAETKAIGRALATLGYGTQFALELDEGTKYADTPVERKSSPSQIQPNGNSKLTAAGVEELREEVIQFLNADTDAKEKLPKGAGEMTEIELSKTLTWLRARALRNA